MRTHVHMGMQAAPAGAEAAWQELGWSAAQRALNHGTGSDVMFDNQA